MRVKSNEDLPNPIMALLPLIVTFMLFNFMKLYIGFSIIIGILTALVCFWRYLGGVKLVMGVLGKGGLPHVYCVCPAAR